MSDLKSRLERFLAELRHRRVLRVGLAYGIVAWLAVQVAATTFPLLYIPQWAGTLVVVLAVIGAPVTLVLAWVFDIVPGRAQSREGAGNGADAVAGDGDVCAAAVGRTGENDAALPALRHVVPPAMTPLVGRVQELRELEALLRDRDNRLITIVGPGGIGKTRLALEVARSAEQRFAHGACFVPLAGMGPTSPLVPTIAECLGVSLGAQERAEVLVSAYLREKSLLLVIDNCEQFTGQAEVLSQILAEAPEVKILATSQERLNLRGESLLPLSGLACASSDDLHSDGHDSTELFLQTAKRVDPRTAFTDEDLIAVRNICAYVQGVPLAIELAAAWVGVLTCEEVWREIQRSRDFLVGSARDLPKRHRSLRAVFEASWQLLADAEREAIRRLSVFRGGFNRDAADRVASAPLAVLASLVEKSFLQRTPTGRFNTLEILRQFAGERLAADANVAAEVSERHAAYYAEFLYSRREPLERMGNPQAANEVSAEIENVREAWRWMIRECRGEEMARALDGMYCFCTARGWAREGEATFGEAARRLASMEQVDASGGIQDLRQRLLARRGVFCTQLADYDLARQLLGEALDHFAGTAEWKDEAFALDQLGVIATYEGDYARANELFRQSEALYRTHGSNEDIARSCVYLGMLAFTRGEYAEARGLFQEGLELFRSVGDRRRVATALKNLGGVAYREEAYEEADFLLQESLAIDRELDNPMAIANSLQNLGCIAFRAGDQARAERYLREGADISRAMGFRRLQAFCLNELGSIYQAQGCLDAAVENYRMALAIAKDIHQLPVTLEILLGFARIAQERSEYERVAMLVTLVLGHPASSEHTREHARKLARALPWPLPTEDEPLAPGAVDTAIATLLREQSEGREVVAASH